MCQVLSVGKRNFVRTNALDDVAVNVIVGSEEKVVEGRRKSYGARVVRAKRQKMSLPEDNGEARKMSQGYASFM